MKEKREEAVWEVCPQLLEYLNTEIQVNRRQYAHKNH
jgi:hypothetical protein